jgi:hypothetical protein
LFLIGLFVFTPSVVPAASPSSIMSQAMLAMMDAMGDLAYRFKNKDNWSLGNSYAPYGSPYGLPGNGWSNEMPLHSPVPGLGGLPAQGGFPSASPFSQPLNRLSPVDGIWLGRGGEIVLVMYGHFRIYASAESYRDGQFEIIGDRLVMYDPDSDRRMLFDYYLENGRMMLRSESGVTLLFKQLPIPIPPYALFSNPTSGYQ